MFEGSGRTVDSEDDFYIKELLKNYTRLNVDDYDNYNYDTVTENASIVTNATTYNGLITSNSSFTSSPFSSTVDKTQKKILNTSTSTKTIISGFTNTTSVERTTNMSLFESFEEEYLSQPISQIILLLVLIVCFLTFFLVLGIIFYLCR